MLELPDKHELASYLIGKTEPVSMEELIDHFLSNQKFKDDEERSYYKAKLVDSLYSDRSAFYVWNMLDPKGVYPSMLLSDEGRRQVREVQQMRKENIKKE